MAKFIGNIKSLFVTQEPQLIIFHREKIWADDFIIWKRQIHHYSITMTAMQLIQMQAIYNV
jgi:hypothetical protein